MSATILDGRLVASTIRDALQQKIKKHVENGHRPPCLAVILLGSDTASTIYVTNKRKACADLGIISTPYLLPLDTSEEALLALLEDINQDPNTDGILVQLPLPKHINTAVIIEKINPKKDVDGFHPINMGKLAQGHPDLRPCTPLGVMRLLDYYHLQASGLSALVIGASTIVGRPMALELLLTKATVTIAHSKTQNLEQLVRQADLIITATGVPGLVRTEWLQEKQIVIDVGIYRNQENQIRGDIDFIPAQEKVAWITPVPGGIGPMTVTMLLENTVQCWLKNIG